MSVAESGFEPRPFCALVLSTASQLPHLCSKAGDLCIAGIFQQGFVYGMEDGLDIFFSKCSQGTR